MGPVVRLPPPASTDSQPLQARRAYLSSSAWISLLSVLILGLALDLGLKTWSFENVADSPVRLNRQQLLNDPHFNPIPPHRGMHALPWSLLDLQLVINRGAVFGIGPNQRFFFIVFTVAALAAGLFVFGKYTTARDRLAHVAIGFILAGGVGNLYDRIVYGVVRDFLHMLPGYRLPFGWSWGSGGSTDLFPWVFNVADVMLLTGMGLLMLHMSRLERRRKQAEQAAAEQKLEKVEA